MKVDDTHAVYELLRECYSVYAQPRLIAEWNYNRLKDAVGDNDPMDKKYGQDIEMFPPESMVQGLRPGRGIIKARVGEGRIAWDYFDDPASPHRAHGEGERYYVAGVNDMYKYWSSPVPSNGSGNWPNHSDGTQLNAYPFALYIDPIRVNKIVIGLENTFASPQNYNIRIQEVDGTWTQIATQANTTIDSEGRITLYYDGSWFDKAGNASRVTAAQNLGLEPCGPESGYGPFDTIRGVQLRVTQMDQPDVYLNVIEISARLERNLTPYLMSVDDIFDLSDHSFTHPIGKASSNSASVVLSNITGLFNNDNEDSQFYNMLWANTKMNMEYVFSAQGSTYPIQQFEMYTETWSGQAEEQVTVDCLDASKFFQEAKPRRVMYEKYTVAEIIWSICDLIGFDKYKIHRQDEDNFHAVDIFWTDKEKTAWEIFAELSEHSQTAIYFDAWGVLQVKTRKAAFDSAQSPVWELYGSNPVSGKVPDIVSLSKTIQYEANHVTVSYQQTKWPEWNRGFPQQQIIWEPGQDNSPENVNSDDSNEEGSTTVVLRADHLNRELNLGDTYFWIDPKSVRHWPYEGVVNIQGEFIRFKGKQFKYYDDAGNAQTKVVTQRSELRELRESTPMFKRHLNRFTGAMKITQRGLWNSESKRHFVEVNGWNTHSYINGNRHTNAKGFRHFKKDSKVRLHMGKARDNQDWLMTTRGEDDDAGFYHYGTRMQLLKGNGGAGFVFHNRGANEEGYYIDIVDTASLNGPRRAARDEVVLYVRKSDGSMKRLGSGAVSIRNGTWFDLDIDFKKDVGTGNDHIVEVAVNGWTMINKFVTGADRATWGGKFGMFIRGTQIAEYEYIYAVNKEEPPRSDESNFFNRVSGGYQSSQWDREWIFNMRSRKDDRLTKKDNDKDRERMAGRFFDEFGPIVHEIREYNVWFEPFPAKTSLLFISNDYEIFCSEYRADNFSADFIISNASRKNAVANGGDTLTFAGGEEVNHRMLVFGQVPIIKNAQQIVARHEDGIRKAGKVETEITSPWIQSKDDAQNLAEFIRDHWAGSADELQVTIFGNPLLELGDVVSVQSPELHAMLSTTHKYYVVGIRNNFDNGLETDLTLRRVRPAPGELT